MVEKILTERLKRKKESQISLMGDLEICGVNYHFDTKIFHDIGFQMSFPDAFTLMPVEQSKIKYISENRPELIYTNQNTQINFTFSDTGEEFVDDTTCILKSFKTAIKNIQPANLFMEQKEFKTSNKLGYMDYVSYAVDGKIYCFLYIFHINKQLIIGSFSCPFDSAEYWKYIVVAMIQTIKTVDGNEG